MPNKCTICTHEKRDEIEAAILKGDALRRIATQYGSSESSVRRHKSRGHIELEIIDVPAPIIERIHTVDPLSELERYRQKLDAMLQKAEEAENPAEARATIREIRENIKVEIVARKELPSEHREVDLIDVAIDAIECLREPHPKAHVFLLNRWREEYERDGS